MRQCTLVAIAALVLAAAACNRQTPAEKQERNSNKPADIAVTPVMSVAEKNFHKYHTETEKGVEALSQQIAALEAKAEQASSDAYGAIAKHLGELYEQRSKINDRLKELRRSGAEKLSEVKPALEEAVKNFKGTLTNTQATIEKAIDEARQSAAFSKSRQEFEQYQMKVQEAVDELDLKINALRAQVNKSASDVKAAAYSQVSSVFEQRSAVRKRLNELRDAGTEGWQQLRSGMDQAVQELGNAVERAGEKLKS